MKSPQLTCSAAERLHCATLKSQLFGIEIVVKQQNTFTIKEFMIAQITVNNKYLLFGLICCDVSHIHPLPPKRCPHRKTSEKDNTWKKKFQERVQ